MRIVKDADIRKKEILNAAAILFANKGFDSTSTNEILEAVGIARGTLYHHFKSKEDIMDALIERQTEQILTAAKKMAHQEDISVEERILHTAMALRANKENKSSEMFEHLHNPQNALMHQKVNQIMMQQIPPILADIIIDGIQQEIFETPYPLECMEMVVIYLQTIFDDGIFELTQQQYTARIRAFIFHLERMLGVEQGKFAFAMQLFQEGDIE